MKLSQADILLVPGVGNSGSGHWQRRWLEKMSTAQWVEQDDWQHPDLDKWTANLERTTQMATRPVVLVGHSLGVSTIVHTAQKLVDTKVCGAFFVAPLDLESGVGIPDTAAKFAPVPRDPLPFPSLLIGSSNDASCSSEAASDMANCWGSEFHNAGEVGHLNPEAGFGPWPDGIMMFGRLMQRLNA